MMWGHEDANLVRLHDGLLDDETSRRVRAHVEQCARCRELDEAITYSRSALSSLSPLEPRDVDRDRMRQTMLQNATTRQMGTGSGRSRRALKPAFAIAAVIALILAGASWWWWFRPGVRFVAGPTLPRSIESIAISHQRSFDSGSISVMEAISSIDVARDRVAAHTGVTTNLKTATRRDRQLMGITPWLIGTTPASSLVYDVDGHPVVLVVAQASSLKDPPPSLLRTKRLELRHDRDTRIFTWSASGDAYSLTVPKDVPIASACAICHDGTRMMRVIESSTRRM